MTRRSVAMRLVVLSVGMGLAMGGLAGCVNGGVVVPEGASCSAAADCAGGDGGAGLLCIAGRCEACKADWQCRQARSYGPETRCIEGRCRGPEEPADCAASPGTAGCACEASGGCAAGLVCDAQARTCRPARTCAEVACADGEACGPSPDGGDARCAPVCDASGSTSANDGCVPRVDCESLACELQGRACEPAPNAHCAGCLAEHTDIGDGERCVPTCKALACGAGSECIEQHDKEPARCVAAVESCGKVPVCDAGQAWDPFAGTCVSCGGLSCAADAARTGRLLPVTTNQGRCLCETRAGYYFDHGTNRIEPCDADGDGFVRRSAWPAMQAKAASACGGDLAAEGCDCALWASARCEVRRVDTIVLHNAGGRTREVALANDPLAGPALAGGALELYEVDANDDLALRGGTGAPVLPVYRQGLVNGEPPARSLLAAELNSFTKACVDPRADFNGNARSDVTEYQGQKLGDAAAAWLEPFVHFGYFVELAYGWYEPNASDAAAPGRYHIQERGRWPGEGGATPVVPMMKDVTDYSAQCQRLTDVEYAASPTARTPNIGMDFARFNPPNAALGPYSDAAAPHFDAWFGHPSQFKCVELVSRYVESGSAPGRRPRQTPHHVLASGPVDGTLYGCWLQAGEGLEDGIACELANASPAAVGSVAWKVVSYLAYPSAAWPAYQRGCVNECAEGAYLPMPKSCSATQSCVVGDHGRHTCNCKPEYKGETCSIRCGYWYLDGDSDFHALVGSEQKLQCAKPTEAGSWQQNLDWSDEQPEDCPNADDDREVYPGAPELCDGKDNDCNPETADGVWECTGDTCNIGVCKDGQCSTVPKCDDHDLCTTDTCDPATGACTNAKVECNDSRSCTTDTCDATTGQCRYRSTCPDTGDPCTVSVCTVNGCEVRNTCPPPPPPPPPPCSPCSGCCSAPCAGGGCAVGACDPNKRPGEC